MNELISVCMPTYKRPELLVEAVQSCFANRHRPLEIVVGDDSPDDASRRAIETLPLPEGIALCYHHNNPRLGQPSNVNSLFHAARGDRIVLLHDDDRILPGAIDIMCGVWNKNADLLMVFGKQRVINMAGVELPEHTSSLNTTRFRIPEKVGLQKSALSASLLAQIPNDGYMVRSSSARAVGYSNYTFRGDGSDYDFGIRLAQHNRNLRCYFVDEFLADYRVTDDAISHASLGSLYMYERLAGLKVSAEDSAALSYAQRRLAASAVMQLAQQGLRRKALGIFLSHHYPVHRLSPKAVFHLAAIAVPPLAAMRRRQRVTHIRSVTAR